MAKGFSLEQLRDQLETDATRRNASQEKTIREQNEQIASLKKRITVQTIAVAAMSRRCRALTHGLFCRFCTVSSDCILDDE
jgi:DNA-binding transcriptional MerR regulator